MTCGYGDFALSFIEGAIGLLLVGSV